jgi:hypothetical protein
MKIKIKVDMNDGEPAFELTTNLFVVCEWERIEDRKVADNKGIGYSDLCCWAYLILKMRGDTLPIDWRKWVKANPMMEISGVDETVGNPTGLALTEGN